MGFRETLAIAANKGLSRIIVEVDCVQVVHALMQAGNSILSLIEAPIFSDCLELLPPFFSCDFFHVKCSCNMVAHSLPMEDWNFGGSYPSMTSQSCQS